MLPGGIGARPSRRFDMAETLPSETYTACMMPCNTTHCEILGRLHDIRMMGKIKISLGWMHDIGTA